MTTLGERFVRALIDTLVELELGGFGDRIGWTRVMCSGFRPTSPG